jgi:hypothetical protein
MKQQLKKYLRGNLLVWNSLLRCRRVIRRSIHKASAAVYQWRFSSIPKREFLQDLRAATLARTGYAAGKIGISQQHWMYYEIFLKKEKDPDKIDLFRNDLIFHGLKQSGVFPADPDFYLKFNEFYMPHVRNLDCLGIFYRPWELEIIRHYKLTNKVTYFQNQPSRSGWAQHRGTVLPTSISGQEAAPGLSFRRDLTGTRHTSDF